MLFLLRILLGPICMIGSSIAAGMHWSAGYGWLAFVVNFVLAFAAQYIPKSRGTVGDSLTAMTYSSVTAIIASIAVGILILLF